MSRFNSVNIERDLKKKEKSIWLLEETLKKQNIKAQYKFKSGSNNSVFTFEVTVNGLTTIGSAFKKSDAKQDAAKNMLNILSHKNNLKFLIKEWNNQQKLSLPLLGELLRLKSIKPKYKKVNNSLLETSNQSRLIIFEITAGELTTRGSGQTQKKAKQEAAVNMLKLMTKNGDEICLTKTKPMFSSIPLKFIENYVSCLEVCL